LSSRSIAIKTFVVLILTFISISVLATSCSQSTTTSKSYEPPALQRKGHAEQEQYPNVKEGGLEAALLCFANRA